MASVAFHNFNQFHADSKVRLFSGWDGYDAGCQQRDFVSVEDVMSVNLHFLDKGGPSGIYNLGTGRAQPFNDVALSLLNGIAHAGATRAELEQGGRQGEDRIYSFPDMLKGEYQSFTQADLTHLCAAGYDKPFYTLEEGVARYTAWLMGRQKQEQ